MNILKEIALYVEKGDSSRVRTLTRTAISKKIHPDEILNGGLAKGMDLIGNKFKNDELFIPEVLIAARAMKAGLDIIKHSLPQEMNIPGARIVLGTVKGDFHDIGKKIVGMILEKEGHEVIDIGIDVPKEEFLRAIEKECPIILGMSALLTTTMGYMRQVIEAVEDANLRQNIKIIIGGSHVTQAFADEIRADGYAPNGIFAAELVTTLLNNKKIDE